MALMMGGDSGVSAFLEGDNIFHWVGTIVDSAATAYEGTSQRLTLAFPSDYPYKPPKVRFDTPCFHPNVDTHNNICLDILQDKWSSAYDPDTPRRAEQRLAAQHASGGAMGKSGRVQKDGGEALQARVVEEGRSIDSVGMLLRLREHWLRCGAAISLESSSLPGPICPRRSRRVLSSSPQSSYHGRPHPAFREACGGGVEELECPHLPPQWHLALRSLLGAQGGACRPLRRGLPNGRWGAHYRARHQRGADGARAASGATTNE